MSFNWSQSSIDKLNTVDPRLVSVFDRALSLGVVDIRILEGHRNKETQDEMFFQKKSELEWPNSKHNKFPSLAVDALPLPFKKEDWINLGKFGMFSGFIIGVGYSMGVKIRSGFDWNKNFDPTDNWIDAPHFELED